MTKPLRIADQLPGAAIAVAAAAILALSRTAFAPSGASPNYWFAGFRIFPWLALTWPFLLFLVCFVAPKPLPPVAVAVGSFIGSWVFIVALAYAKHQYLSVPQFDDPQWMVLFNKSHHWTLAFYLGRL